MINLIKNEFKKIFSKKSFYIVTILFLLFTILINAIYNDDAETFYAPDVNINELIEENKTLDLNNQDHLYTYVNNLTRIELDRLKKEFNDTNKEYLLDKYYQNELYSFYYAKYISKENIKEEERNIEELLNKIESGDWQYFVKLDIEELKQEETYNEIDKIRNNYFTLLYEYRINNNIDFDNKNYLNKALNSIESNLYEYVNLKNKEKLTNMEKSSLENIERDMIINKYILENKVDANATNTLRVLLTRFTNEFGLFILIYVILISASIVSEEFNKGTIKYLLTKPYKRSTILTSKLLTLLILLPCIVLLMLLIELIVGGFVFGYDSLNVPVLVYQAATHSIKAIPVFTFVIKMLFASMPMYLVILIFSFMVSTVTLSTSAASTLSFMFYFVGGIISNLAMIYSFKVFKLLVPLYWDFSYLVTGDNHPFSVSTLTSLSITLLYIVVMLCITYVYFRKKDVKNI